MYKRVLNKMSSDIAFIENNLGIKNPIMMDICLIENEKWLEFCEQFIDETEEASLISPILKNINPFFEIFNTFNETERAQFIYTIFTEMIHYNKEQINSVFETLIYKFNINDVKRAIYNVFNIKFNMHGKQPYKSVNVNIFNFYGILTNSIKVKYIDDNNKTSDAYQHPFVENEDIIHTKDYIRFTLDKLFKLPSYEESANK